LTAKVADRFEYLDVLRGIAVLAVCFMHITGYVYRTYGSSHPLSPMIDLIVVNSVDWGRFGVVLFFLISGFIIPNSLKPGSSLSRFFVSRIFRLYPVYWVVLGVIFFTAPFLHQSQASYSNFEVIANITMMPNLFGVGGMSGVFWSLFIELLFYFSCAALFKLNWLDKPIVIAIAAIGLNLTAPIPIILNEYFGSNLPVRYLLYHLSFLFAGNLFRLALVNKDKLAFKFSILFLLILMITIPVSAGSFFNVLEAKKKGFVLFTAPPIIYAYVLAVGLFVSAIYFKNFKNKFLIKLGQISYSLYLYHMTCFALVMKFISTNTTEGFLLYFLLSTILAYAVAYYAYIYIEYPAINLGRKVIKRLKYA
jgi:peptidoglycan/LPS O-acetylase OafA/YrhL